MKPPVLVSGVQNWAMFCENFISCFGTGGGGGLVCKFTERKCCSCFFFSLLQLSTLPLILSLIPGLF